MTEGVKDKVVIITGASSGLGEATARLLSAKGASVMLGARRADRLKSLVKEISAGGRNAIAIRTGVTDREQIKALVHAAVETYGRVDVMLNNAGLMPQAPLDRLKRVGPHDRRQHQRRAVRLSPVAPSAHAPPAVAKVLRAVWLPGLGLALSSVGFGAITTFTVLLFAQRGWDQAWLAVTSVSVTFILGRVVFGHLPDRIGGPKVALVCVLIEAAGHRI
jgi:NAD(P)-dependent dehydrogenase (short-subunit alcohol dehydrogenase family)